MSSPISPVTVRACFTFRLVSLEHNDGADVRDGSALFLLEGGGPHEDDSPVQLSRLHVDQVERFTAGQQQEVRLKPKTLSSEIGREIRTGNFVTDNSFTLITPAFP